MTKNGKSCWGCGNDYIKFYRGSNVLVKVDHPETGENINVCPDCLEEIIGDVDRKMVGDSNGGK